MRRIIIGPLLAAAGLLVGGLTAPAAAATTSPGPAERPRHCVANVDTGRTVCASDTVSIAEARNIAAGGGLRSVRPARSAVRVATLFSGFLDQGISLDIYASSGCTSSKLSREWTLNNVGSAINDETSSVRVFHNCRVRLYDAANCPSSSARYPSTGYAGTTNYVGDWMNDRTTCVTGS